MGTSIYRGLFRFIGASRNHHNPVVCLSMAKTCRATITTDIHQFCSDDFPVFKHVVHYGDKIAMRDVHGDYTYRGLYFSAKQFSNELNILLGEGKQERIAFLLPNDASYIIVQWACWMSGQIAVPLNENYPQNLLHYFVTDSGAKIVISTEDKWPLLHNIVIDQRVIIFDNTLRVLAMKSDGKASNNKNQFDQEFYKYPKAGLSGNFYNKSYAMCIYTSGTTSKPKGAMLTHKNIYATVNSLVQAWKMTNKDIVLHTLPLNNIHGVVDGLICPLYIGGQLVMLPKFEISSVWSQILGINQSNTDRINIFMAVPSMYVKLIKEYDQLFCRNKKIQGYIRNVCAGRIRLMISGSTPLPKPILHRWEEITGHRLLERYGMTETGMVLSNPLEGERIPGRVGAPLPGVEVRLTKSSSNHSKSDVLVKGTSTKSVVFIDSPEPITGDLEVRGENVFKMYWNRPKTTEESFTIDKWFKTGDTVQYRNGTYKILGRSSTDIIKIGGFKVSALEVEATILGHPRIVDCAVIGIPDLTWGQKVSVISDVLNTKIVMNPVIYFLIRVYRTTIEQGGTKRTYYLFYLNFNTHKLSSEPIHKINIASDET